MEVSGLNRLIPINNLTHISLRLFLILFSHVLLSLPGDCSQCLPRTSIVYVFLIVPVQAKFIFIVVTATGNGMDDRMIGI
jgi:hypothetical protein